MIREMLPLDIPAVVRLHTSLSDQDKRFYHPCKMNAWNVTLFLLKLRAQAVIEESMKPIIYIEDNRVVGFLFLRPRDGNYELGIVTSEKYRNHGVGHKLMDGVVRYARLTGINLWLRVLRDNFDAVKLYLDSGFVPTRFVYNTYKGEEREFYEMELYT